MASRYGSGKTASGVQMKSAGAMTRAELEKRISAPSQGRHGHGEDWQVVSMKSL
jgi:hypothetical protein